jgi:exopolysaccharide biosynthesis polyprenyl glycosylphosphotransferase
MEKNMSVYLVPNLFEISINRSRLVQVDYFPMFHIRPSRLEIEERALKCGFDFIASLFLLALMSPLMCIAAIATKCYDHGRVFFKQERVTRDGRKFMLIKFRTMIEDAEEQTGPVWSVKRDPRITKVGSFLRRTRIDELPQLFNVLKGEMSLVGPRPEREHFIVEFEKEFPSFKHRLAVKAGITGLAQVLGKYNTTPEDKLKFDLMYITNYSFLLDLKILLQTIRVIFSEESTQGVNNESGA